MLTLRDLIEQPPLIHNRGITWGIRPALAHFLDDAVGPGSVTLETRAGLSTLVILRKQPRQHTAIQPVPDTFAAIVNFAEHHRMDIGNFRAIVARSQDWLPRVDLPDLDLVLVDGSHAFPIPFLDWYYSAEKLKVGGLMVVDYTHLLTGTVLADFMGIDTAWEPVERDDVSHFAIYRKRVHPVHDDDWIGQPYVRDAYPTESIRVVRGAVPESLSQPPDRPAIETAPQLSAGSMREEDRERSLHQTSLVREDGRGEAGLPGPVDSQAERPAGAERAPVKDFTKSFDYERLLDEEKGHYSHIEVTADLREGGPHASSCWQYYWERVATNIPSEFSDMPRYLSRRFGHLHRPLEILSLGSGYCGHELALARGLVRNYRIRCTDINEHLFDRARQVVREEGLAVEFGVADLNFLAIEAQRYDLILAHAVLHHVINLEHLFENVAAGLAANGVFHLVDVAGQNRKLIWDPSERLVNALLETIPDDITQGLRVNAPYEAEGMEGIRQAEVIPQLRMRFTPLFEHQHGSFMRFIGTNQELSGCFDPRDERARRYLDFLIDVDDVAVRSGVLPALEIWGIYRPRPAGAI